MDVTDEKIHDGRMLNKLINDVLRLSLVIIKVQDEDKIVISHDRTNDFNAYFQYVEDKKINSAIKARSKNSIIFLRNNWLKNRETKT